MALKINDKAPDFSLPSSEGGTFTLSKNMADRPCVLYFYPKNWTKKLGIWIISEQTRALPPYYSPW